MSGLVAEIVGELRSNYGEEIEKIKTLEVDEIQKFIDKINGDTEFQKVLQEYKEYLEVLKEKNQEDLKNELIELFKEKQSGGALQNDPRTLGHRKRIRDEVAKFERNNPTISVFIGVLIVGAVLLKDLFGNNQNAQESTAEAIHNILNSTGTSNGGRKRVKSNRKSKKQSKSKRKGNRRRSVRYRRRR